MLRYKELSRKFIATQQQDISVRTLHSLKNDFIHFRPTLLYMDTEKLPQVAKDCLSVIRFLALDSGNIWYRNEYSPDKMGNLIKRVEAAMDELTCQYSSKATE